MYIIILYMDILKKIDELRRARGWSVYKLAEESGLTQSTLANMFARGTQPTISTLESICKAYGISLAEFFSDNQPTNTISTKFQRLCDADKKIIYDLIDRLSK